MNDTPQYRHSTKAAVLTGILFFSFFLVLICVFVSRHNQEDRLRMEYIARTVEAETYETLQTQMSKTLVSEAHLIETGGSYENFGPIAAGLIRDDAVRSLLFAPDGVIQGIFPMEGNESVAGLDLNSEGMGNLEAQAAIEKGELFLAGPFDLVEGGMGICGRLPVYLDNDDGQRTYWGLVTITLSYPQIFENNPIHHVNEQGFACRVWRVNPDDGQRQTILETAIPVDENASVEEYRISMFNAEWVIWLAPLRAWYRQPMVWLLLLGCIAVSGLVAYAVFSAQRLREMEASEDRLRIQALQQKLEWEKTNTLLSQISSHFFYHTLNALQALIVLEPNAAYKMAGDFSRYLRFNVDAITAAGGIVTFREEMRSVRAYAEINEAQLGSRLRVVFETADVDFKIPALSIQPIVENAILHGIKPKPGGGTVTVQLTEDRTHWHITVTDNGMGFDPAQVHSESVGLPNVRQRISGFADCSMDMHSIPGKGTRVSLHISKNLQKK